MFQLFFLFSLKERVKEVIRICHWSHHLFYTKGVVSLLVLSSAVLQTALVSIESRLCLSGLLGADITTEFRRYLTKQRSYAHTLASFAVHINKKATAQIRKPFIYLK